MALQNVKPEDLEAWKQHPVTELFIAQLRLSMKSASATVTDTVTNGFTGKEGLLHHLGGVVACLGAILLSMGERP